MKKYDVVIAGAGASGLLCARILSHAGLSVAVIEAGGRPGGRVHTLTEPFSVPVEGGAEFIHGNMNMGSEQNNEKVVWSGFPEMKR